MATKRKAHVFLEVVCWAFVFAFTFAVLFICDLYGQGKIGF